VGISLVTALTFRSESMLTLESGSLSTEFRRW
jgi:hypothetical protein